MRIDENSPVIGSAEWHFKCETCGATADPGPDESGNGCAACGGLLQVEWAPGTHFTTDRTERSLWRYRSVLPVAQPGPDLTLGEGWTPLVQGVLAGRRVLFKLESTCPSGSFKDRGAVILVQYARASGATEIVIDSSGNAAAAVSMYAARAGMGCRVFVPADNSPGKLTQAAAHGAQVVRVEGSRADATAAAEDAAGEGVFYANHNRSSLFVEGVKTWLLEVAEVADRRVRLAFIPTGGGSAVAGAAAALRLLDRPFELHGVQPAGCAPLAAAFKGITSPLVPEPSIAEGANIAAPPRMTQVLRDVRASGGSIIAVTDEAILQATRELWAQGIYAEPTGALGAAGFRAALDAGTYIEDDEAVIMITGHGLKTTHLNASLLAT